MKKHIFIFVLYVLHSTYTIPNGAFYMLKNRLDWYLLSISYKKNEQSYNTKLNNTLNKTEYPKITKACAYLIWNNYYVRKEFSDFYKLKDIVSIGLFGKQNFEQQKKFVPLFYELLETKKIIFENAHKQVYDESYYNKEQKLRKQINDCRKDLSTLLIFKNEPSFKKTNSSGEL